MPLPPPVRQTLAARAATIDERHAALTGAPVGAIHTDDAGSALRHWNQAFAPNDPDAFARRLAWDGFDLASAARAASPAIESAITVDAGWTIWIDHICAEAPGVLADVRAGHFAPSPDERDHAQPFEELWAPAVRSARRALAAVLPPDARTFVAPDVFDAFDRQLARELGRYGDLALFEHFRAFTAPSAPSASSAPFATSMLEGGLIDFFVRYAALARQLATVLDRWVATTAEWFARLVADRAAIVETFSGGDDPGMVTRVDLALSDPHHGRRRVSALTFASGLRLIYKPRSVRIEHAFGGLLRWLNTGLDHPLRVLAVLDRGTHGWVEFAAHEPLAGRAEVSAYFHRAGALMCLTSVLGARDLHRDNLVATPGGPVLVDLELLLQPEGPASGPQADAQGHDAHGAQGRRDLSTVEGQPLRPAAWSCLSTGMLSLIDLTPDGEPHDAGGLRGARTGALPFSKRVWKQCGTDRLHWVDEAGFVVAGTHQVLVEGKVQDPGDHSGALVAGFSQAYRLLLARRGEVLAPGGPLGALASCFVRVLPRPTNQYAMLAHLLATPKYQGDGVTAGCTVDVLHRGYSRSRTRPALWPVAVEERRAMLALDIPYFTVRADGTDGFADGRFVAGGFFTRSGLQVAGDRLRALSFADLAAQIALLRRALSESVESRYDAIEGAGADAARAGFDGAEAPSLQLHKNRGGVDPGMSMTRTNEALSMARTGLGPCAEHDDLVDAAEWVGRALLARAERVTGGGLVWRYRPAVGGPGWRDHHLYDGSLGLGLFYTALARVTRRAEWADVARDVMAPVRAHAGRHAVASLPSDEPIGGGNGLGSVVYGLTVVASLSGDEWCADLACDLADAIASHIHADTSVDVINGAAGAVLALLALHEATGEARALDAAVACGRHLLARASDAGPGAVAWPAEDGTRLLGFAHGSAGIACALTRLAVVTGDAAFARTARRAFRFVRRHHLQTAGNWPIAVTGDGEVAGGLMTGWCHGAPGVVLAALSAVSAHPSPALRPGIEAAVHPVAAWQPAQADHLCCGALGRAEVLLVAGDRLGRPEAVDAARATARQAVTRARRRGHFRLSGAGTDYRVFDPGFFQGLSGIGYGLLRLAGAGELPSVLAFDTPRATLRYCSPGAGQNQTRERAARPAGAVSTECTSS